jgi:hypothetical protein
MVQVFHFDSGVGGAVSEALKRVHHSGLRVAESTQGK